MKIKKSKQIQSPVPQTSIKRAIALSLFLHMLPILLFIFMGGMGGSGNGGEGDKDKGGGAEQADKRQIVPKPSEEQPTEIEIVEVEGIPQKKKPTVPHENEKCEHFFGGIGITHGQFMVIQTVHEGYPAHNAGIKPGDKILSPVGDIRGEVGTEITIELLTSEGEYRTITLVRDKICVTPYEVEP